MNAKNLFAAVTIFTAAGAALADNTYPYVDHSNFAGTKTRAEVVGELKQASTSGALARNKEYVEHTNVASGKTRAEVRAELEADVETGRYASNNKEFVEFTAVASTRTRDEVRSEAIQAAKSKQANRNLIGG